MIEFLENNHIYLVDGVQTPSVTQIIGKAFIPGMYDGVPQKNLSRAAAYGNKVHELIESYAMTGEPKDAEGFSGLALKRYIELANENDIKIASVEKNVCYRNGDVPVYAGKYDLTGTVGGIPSILDIKTTADYHQDYLRYQLTMYAMAMMQMDITLKLEKAYCLWMPKKGLGRLIPVEFLNKEELENRINEAYSKYFAEGLAGA